ncbi:MAG: YceD family protein [Hyphomicrobiaceae bacterium]
MADESSEQYLSQIVSVDEVTPKGLVGTVDASADEKVAIADALDLEALHSLLFSFKIFAVGKNRFTLNGTLQASLAQRCVVTLEPLESDFCVDVSLEFWPRDALVRIEETAEDATANIELDGPEPMDDGVIDVGHLTYEIFVSNLDPYPRKSDATFSWSQPDAAASARTDSPFATLKTLGLRKN